jgi:hypothetical protein
MKYILAVPGLDFLTANPIVESTSGGPNMTDKIMRKMMLYPLSILPEFVDYLLL